MTERLIAILREFEAHQVSNPGNALWLTDDTFLGSTDGTDVSALKRVGRIGSAPPLCAQ